MHQLAKRTPEQIRKPLWKLLTSPEWLAQAWEQIRRNRGSQTAGIDNKTALDVDINLIHKLAEELRTGKYRPKPVRRVLIPKANGKTRPLGIPTIKDRIVQQAVKMLLEPIFEADFLNCSHGFRQGRSTHTALRDVARSYPPTSWIIEGDIEACFDNISHAKLLNRIGNRLADEKVLNLIRLFLKAGYMEDWRYHKTYSGTAQGGIISPLLANIFLHQLDEYIEKELDANRSQSQKQLNSRRNPEYCVIERRITRLRRKLRETDREGHRLITGELRELERQRKRIPFLAKEKKHPCKVKYVRYADDFVLLIVGAKSEAEAIRNKVKERLSEMGLSLNEGKTKITHWSRTVPFLGYNIKGKLKERGVGIRAGLMIPQERKQKVKDTVKQICGYYHIPEADAMNQLSAVYRGWSNYYRYATSPQRAFNDIAYYVWSEYAHLLARKQKSSIAKMIRREREAGRLRQVKKNNRLRTTFQTKVGNRTMTLDNFPPQSGQIRTVPNGQEWRVDLKPVIAMSWQSGRSLTTRLAALDRANGVCEGCKEKAIEDIHHRVPIRGRAFLARVMSDQRQKETAIALCKGCHLEAHGGSFSRKSKRKRGNAGYIERVRRETRCWILGRAKRSSEEYFWVIDLPRSESRRGQEHVRKAGDN